MSTESRRRPALSIAPGRAPAGQARGASPSPAEPAGARRLSPALVSILARMLEAKLAAEQERQADAGARRR